ncbi:MAG: hypothetical protein PHH77_03625 [Victivallaceae bacterium]|nr:hypothetical protein [Victivallaceae bacterium]
MKKLLLYALMLLGTAAAGEKPLFVREVTVTGITDADLTVKLEFFLPASCSGYRLMNEHSREYALHEYYRRGSRVKIFFSARSGKKLYLVFYKNPVKHPEQEQTSGVLRQVKAFAGENIGSLAQFRELWERNPPDVGRFESRIFSGWNPFGPKRNSLHWYSAFIRIPQNGKWIFYSASTDASFFLIDGKLVVNAPGRRWVRPGQEGKINGAIPLKPGIHRLDYLHANYHSDYCYAIAAFHLPGDKEGRYQVIPESYYLPVLTATAGPLQTFLREPTADFSWELNDMLEIDGRQMYVVKFTTPFKKFLSWSLGYKEPEFNYFYFKPGEYPVSLECNLGKIGEKVTVDYQYLLKPIEEKMVKKYIREALEQERLHGIQPEGYAFLADALIKYRMEAAAKAFYERLLTRQRSVPPEIIFKLFDDLVLGELLRRECYEAAEKQLKLLLGIIKTPELRSAARLTGAELRFYGLGDTTGARHYFAAVRRQELSSNAALRRYDLLRADLALMTKGMEAAAELYQKIKPAAPEPEGRAQLLTGGMLIAARNCYILKKYADALEHAELLENAGPRIRLEPSYLLLKAKILNRLNRPRRAAGILQRLLKTEAGANIAAAANWQLAQFYFEHKQYSAARRRLIDILNNAPRSREAAEAPALLEKIEKELRL